MAETPIKRTTYAQQGLDFTTLFGAKFGRLDVDGYVPHLREPPAESTGGGAQAVQHLVFEPREGPRPMLTVGSVNVVTRTAKLRTFDCVEAMFSMRFTDRDLGVRQASYQDFFDRAREFLQRQGMHVDVETRPPQVGSVRPPGFAGTGGTWLYVVLAVAVLGGLTLVGLIVTGRLAF